MEKFNTFLGIVASVIAIVSALFSWDTNKKIKQINKSQSGDNSISSSGNGNTISQKNFQEKR